jgi:cobalt-zinc-cadmium efflux system membrane fusion protein
MRTVSTFAVAAAAAALISLGAAGFWVADRLVWHPDSMRTSPPLPAAAPPVAAERSALVTLTPEMAARAGIETATAQTGQLTRTLRAPGTVEPDAYRQTAVTAIAAGTVTAVRAGLGEVVRKDQILVEMFTRDYAEAEHMLLSAQIGLEAAEKRRERSEKLAAIGGVSAQEVDDARAEEARQLHAVDEASARLRLLGPIRAPAAGVVTKRAVNSGQSVQPGAELLTISDLSTVWVMAEIYERDLAAVREGSAARVVSRSYPDSVFAGRVAYLDPEVSVATRTVRARIETANTGRRLRLGMLVDVEISGTPAQVLLIPKSAVQQIGERAVVFVTNGPGRYEARIVTLGSSSGDEIEVKSGVTAGETVVTSGSFALRAEWERKR